MSKKVMLSGIQPSGRPHLGNYFGAMKQFVDLQDSHESYVFIADYHALHSLRNPKEMNENIKNVLLDYLAIGLDPKKVTLYKQSDIPEHTELAWIFETLTTMPYLMRAHAFKDAEAKNKEIDVGTFNYPMLMSADILMYEPDVVPVGIDQKQHIEIARDTAQKFNNTFGETFKLPEHMILENVAVVPGTDGQKMSKSYGNTIPLFAEYEEIKKCVMSIVTNSGLAKIVKAIDKDKIVQATLEGFPENVYNIHKLVRSEEELKPIYEENKGKYKVLKELLIEDLEKFIAPMREERKKWEARLPEALEILKKGGEVMRAKAQAKMTEVKEKIGVNIY